MGSGILNVGLCGGIFFGCLFETFSEAAVAFAKIIDACPDSAEEQKASGYAYGRAGGVVCEVAKLGGGIIAAGTHSFSSAFAKVPGTGRYGVAPGVGNEG